MNIHEVSIPRRFGNIDGGVKFGSNPPIKLSILIKKQKDKNLHMQADELKLWLKGDNWKTGKLVFGEQPNKYVIARASNSVQLNDLFVSGEGEIEFHCSNPIKYDVNETVLTNPTASNIINYQGAERAPAVIEITFTKDVSRLVINQWFNDVGGAINSLSINGNFKVGQTLIIDSDKKVVRLNGQPAMKLFGLKSKWIYLDYGKHKFQISGVENDGIMRIQTGTKLKYRTAD